MTVDELLDAVAELRPEDVSALLAEHVGLLVEQVNAVGDGLRLRLEASNDEADPAAATGLQYTQAWFSLLLYSMDVLWDPDQPTVQLTRFAQDMLARATPLYMALRLGGEPPVQQERWWATDEELLRLDDALDQESSTAEADAVRLLALGCIAEIAFRTAQNTDGAIFSELAATLALITETLLLCDSADHTLIDAGVPVVLRWCEATLPGLAEGTPLRALVLMTWGSASRKGFSLNGDVNWLWAALDRYAEAEAEEPGLSPGSASHAGLLSNWGYAHATAYEAIGDIEQLEAALQCYSKAAALVPGFPEGSANRAKLLVNWGLARWLAYEACGGSTELEAALRCFEEAVNQEPGLAEGSADLARLLMGWGAALRTTYEVTGESAQIEAALDRFAEAARQEPGLAEGSPDRARLLMNWAMAHERMYEATGDRAHLEQALEQIAEAARQEPGLAEGTLHWALLLMNWGFVLSVAYEVTGATKLLDMALDCYVEGAEQPGLTEGSPHYAALLVNMGATLRQRYTATTDPEDLGRALECYAEAAEQQPGLATGTPRRALLLMSWADALGGAYLATTKLEYLQAALDRYAEAAAQDPGLAKGAPNRALLLTRWGNALLADYWVTGSMDQLRTALDRFSEAVIQEPGFADGTFGRIYLLMSWGQGLAAAYEATGDGKFLDWALERYADAGEQELELEDGTPNRTPLLMHWGDALHKSYLANRNPETLAQAYRVLTLAVVLLEERLFDLPERQLQRALLTWQGDAYQGLIGVCLDLAAAATSPLKQRRYQLEAWQLAERSKARQTVQMLQEVARSIGNTAPASELADPRWELLGALGEARQAIARLLLAAESSLATLPGRTTETTMQIVRAQQTELAQLHEQEAEHLEALRQLDQSLSRVQTVSRPNRRAIQVQLRTVPDGAVLVELVPLADRLAVFMLEGESFRVEALPITAEVIGRQTLTFWSWRRDLDDTQRPDYRFATLPAVLDWLGTQLWPLLAPHLPESKADGAVKHLLLVPTGPLHFWPLWALPIPGTNECLLDRAAVTVLPSADALPALAQQPVRPGSYRGFAPPTDLRFAGAQVQYEAAMLGGEALRGPAASLKALLEQTGGSVTLATHGVADLSRPEHSAVYMAGEDGTPYPVSVLEFAVGLDRLGCELLGLMTCESHGAGAEAGDTWGGLVRAFLRAGRTLLASLWPIGDAATLALSVPLCDGLRDGLTIPQALRKAMLALRDADWARVVAWGERVEAALPEEEREQFLDQWQAVMAIPSPTEWGNSNDRPHFGRLEYWAPYLAIGWPGVLDLQTAQG